MGNSEQDRERAFIFVQHILGFYRAMETALDDWLRRNPALLAEYVARSQSIAMERSQWSAELEAIVDDRPTIMPPTAQAVEDLSAAVKKLSERVAVSKALEDFISVFAEAVTLFAKQRQQA